MSVFEGHVSLLFRRGGISKREKTGGKALGCCILVYCGVKKERSFPRPIRANTRPYLGNELGRTKEKEKAARYLPE